MANKFLNINSYNRFVHEINNQNIEVRQEKVIIKKGTLAERTVSLKLAGEKIEFADKVKDFFLKLFSKEYREATIFLENHIGRFQKRYSKDDPYRFLYQYHLGLCLKAEDQISKEDMQALKEKIQQNVKVIPLDLARELVEEFKAENKQCRLDRKNQALAAQQKKAVPEIAQPTAQAAQAEQKPEEQAQPLPDQPKHLAENQPVEDKTNKDQEEAKLTEEQKPVVQEAALTEAQEIEANVKRETQAIEALMEQRDNLKTLIEDITPKKTWRDRFFNNSKKEIVAKNKDLAEKQIQLKIVDEQIKIGQGKLKIAHEPKNGTLKSEVTEAIQQSGAVIEGLYKELEALVKPTEKQENSMQMVNIPEEK